jgi:hypothetical protein
MQYEDIYEGLRVRLTNPNKSYKIGRSNPAVGTMWECGGVVDSLLDSIGVAWDNGKENTYNASDLSPEKDVMNLTGRCTSIW